jgi:two-component system LytT family response regulator
LIFLIVDDEANARNLLKNFLLELNIPAQNIITAADIKSAVKIINNQPIDLVLLDIEMPQENGFALFDYFKNPTFKTIFCTAYSEYALKAFEVSAVDYLLKPISLKKLEEAIQKINNYKPINQTETSVLKENLEEKSFKKIGIQLGDSLVFFKIEDIYIILKPTVRIP